MNAADGFPVVLRLASDAPFSIRQRIVFLVGLLWVERTLSGLIGEFSQAHRLIVSNLPRTNPIQMAPTGRLLNRIQELSNRLDVPLPVPSYRAAA